jgi:hypothetical protein
MTPAFVESPSVCAAKVTGLAPAPIETNFCDVIKTEIPEEPPLPFGKSLPHPTAGRTPARSERTTATLVAYFKALL